jgi:MoaA/NifB/PqqE/SkfB family radical SAM enzyme
VATEAPEGTAGSVARATPTTAAWDDRGAPLYIAWQVTNECNLACLHCIEESGPGKAFRDELSEAEVFSFLEQVVDEQVPYVSFSGGEPTLQPLFFSMVEYVCAGRTQLKIETNGHGLSIGKCERLKSLGVKAVQVSLDGASRETFNRMRVRGDFAQAIDGIRNLRAAGVLVEINYSPTLFNVHEIGLAVDLAHELSNRRQALIGGQRAADNLSTETGQLHNAYDKSARLD